MQDAVSAYQPGNTIMIARIINRGRGPEIEGTRVTVYRIMDFVREGSSVERIAIELHLTEGQVLVALDYIAARQLAVEAEYEKILQRVQQRHSPHIRAGRAVSTDALKQRIRTHHAPDVEGENHR